ncbi:HAD-IB family hydrolase [uncultured Clostridium sp.]|uniref:HAD-IB family hydrolase n=1 Tax=uncultured Clostridium sp. TaxID=59620 RepID=UPI0028E44BE4|nr:HAD-IB family hydrolase [uncultured Clostridium sp.]
MAKEKVKLAIFDIDFTLTKRETLTEFYMFMLKRKPKLIKYLPRSLKAGFFYIFKIYDAGKAKENFISFIESVDEKEMNEAVKEFYSEKLSKILYKDAMDIMKDFKEQGYKIYLISASAEFYLFEFYNIPYVDKIIGTRFVSKDGKYYGKIEGKNCKGEEKVNRLMEYLKEENIEVDFKNSYMFSDSLSDLPLFKLVGNPRLINYKKGHTEIQILKWK